MSAMDAALDIPLADFAAWGEAARMAANVRTLYRWYSGGDRASAPEVLAEMAEWERRRRSSTPAGEAGRQGIPPDP